LRSLDRFYRAIEDAAHGLDDFTEKQHFLNTVYERFFQGYSVRSPTAHGIVYHAGSDRRFHVPSVAEVLQTEFGLTLGSPGVKILDPCTGSRYFIVTCCAASLEEALVNRVQEVLLLGEIVQAVGRVLDGPVEAVERAQEAVAVEGQAHQGRR